MAGKSAVDPQDEAVRLLAILVRRQCDNQVEAILELNRGGFGGTRIAELLGTTANTVNVTVQKNKKKKSVTKKAASDGSTSGGSEAAS